MSANELAKDIFSRYETGAPFLVALSRYRIGDDFECECVASGLTVSPEHTLELRREGNDMRCVTFFAPETVPESYRDRTNPGGVVPMALSFALSDVWRLTNL